MSLLRKLGGEHEPSANERGIAVDTRCVVCSADKADGAELEMSVTNIGSLTLCVQPTPCLRRAGFGARA